MWWPSPDPFHPTLLPGPQVAHGIAADNSLVSDLRQMFKKLDPEDTGKVPYERMQQALQVGAGWQSALQRSSL